MVSQSTKPSGIVTSVPHNTTITTTATAQTDKPTSLPIGSHTSQSTLAPISTSPTYTLTSTSSLTTSPVNLTPTTNVPPTQTTPRVSSPPPTVLPTSIMSSTKLQSDSSPTFPITTLLSTTPQSTMKPSTTEKPLNCENGGYYNGSHCICPPGFNETYCENVIDFQPETLNRSVVVDVVIHQEYDERYNDKQSPEYKEFVGNFTTQMENYYQEKEIPSFKNVVVINVSPGSPLVRFLEKIRSSALATYTTTPRERGIRVIHDVILRIPNNAVSDQVYLSDYTAVKDAADNLVGCQRVFSYCPYNVTESPIVNTTKVDGEALCLNSVANPDVAQFYEPQTEQNGLLTCVTVCDRSHSTPKTCNNRGDCRVYKDTGPVCLCHSMISTWYLSNDCGLPIEKTAFYIGLGVTLACLLVTVGALTTYVLINKHKLKKRREIKEKLVFQWLNEEFEWSRSNSLSDTYNADYENPTFTFEESSRYSENPDDYRQPVPVYQLSQSSEDADNITPTTLVHMSPSNQLLHGNNTPVSTGSLVGPPRDFSSNMPMRTSSVQIRPSSEI
nr:mucin-3B-like isoform X2 [Solea senegalensis]